MILSQLPPEDIDRRLRGTGILFRTGPFVSRVRSSFRELAEPIGFLYGDYPLVEEGGIVDFDVRLAPPSLLRRWIAPQVAAYVDGKRQFLPFPRKLALPMLEWVLNWCTFSRPTHYLILHSGVVERGGRALLVSGHPGAGKSTLCAGLILRGWRLLSDEVALIRPGKNRILPVPRPVGLKEGSIAAIARFEPTAAIGPSFPDTRKGTVAHLRPPKVSVRRSGEAAEPGWVLFPEYRAGVGFELNRVPRTEALLRVGRNSFNYSKLGAVGFETLADLIEASECYELTYGDLDQAVRLLSDLADEAAAVAGTGLSGAGK
jgi:HprK-related kinase A